MTINYVNSENLWLQNTIQCYLKKILAVKDNEMSQIGIAITQLWDVYIKGVLHNKI